MPYAPHSTVSGAITSLYFMIGHSSSGSRWPPFESGHFLVALRSNPLPACPLCLLLFSVGLRLCFCCCLLLFP